METCRGQLPDCPREPLIDRNPAANSPKALDLKKLLYLNELSSRHGFMRLKLLERPVSPAVTVSLAFFILMSAGDGTYAGFERNL
jgi:hypothetical protein